MVAPTFEQEANEKKAKPPHMQGSNPAHVRREECRINKYLLKKTHLEQ